MEEFLPIPRGGDVMFVGHFLLRETDAAVSRPDIKSQEEHYLPIAMIQALTMSLPRLTKFTSHQSFFLIHLGTDHHHLRTAKLERC